MTRHFRIHPAMGVARIGNSPDDFFTGPETPGVPANWDDDKAVFKSFRDDKGRILRQGARFRVFEYIEVADGTLRDPTEVSIGGDVTDIEWRVHLANRKASFFTFHGQFGADDVYVARSSLVATQVIKADPDRTNLRNADVPLANRDQLLDIDPGEQLISKATRPGPVELANTTGAIPIPSLGTLRLDDNGRLIVLGGYGESRSTETPPRRLDEYANNDTWFDDAADGSVKARVKLRDGSFVDADPAWVIVGPPDFAPGVGNVVTLYDTLWDIAAREVDLSAGHVCTLATEKIHTHARAWSASAKRSLAGVTPSFTDDICPLLRRALDARHTHASGIGNPQYHVRTLSDPALLSSLKMDQLTRASELRQFIFAQIRDPGATTVNWTGMPRGFGDDYTPLGAGEPPTPASFLSVTRIQYALLTEWAKGNFVDDWSGAIPAPQSKQAPTPDDLDKAATENCVGGPFFPGIEVSWLIRVKDLFSEPFRLKLAREPVGSETTPPLQVGALLFRPGFFSQQMALPWQADFYDCHRERQEDPDGNEYYFMWWTAQRPDDVYPSGADGRERWVRAFDDGLSPEEADDVNRFQRFDHMQKRWHELRFVSVSRNGQFEEEPSDA